MSVLLRTCPTDTHIKLDIKGLRKSWLWEIYSDWSRTSLRKAEWENSNLSKCLVQFQPHLKGVFSKCTSLTSENALESHCRTQQEASVQVCFYYVRCVSENYFEWSVYCKSIKMLWLPTMKYHNKDICWHQNVCDLCLCAGKVVTISVLNHSA